MGTSRERVESNLRRPPARMPQRTVWMDGRLARGAEATLSVFDRGARDGEGLFETIRVEGRRPFQWERHLERLVLSAAELGFPVPAAPAELADALQQVLAAEGLDQAVARVTVTRGIPGARPTRSTAWVDAEPLAGRLWSGTRRGGARLVRSRVPFTPGWIGRHKTTSRIAYHLAREEARTADADETLLVTPEGAALEGATSNLFVARGATLVTPPLASGVLPGIVRAWVFRVAPELGLEVDERTLDADRLADADEVLVTNSIQGVVSVIRLDDSPIRTGGIGPRLRARLAAAIAADER